MTRPIVALLMTGEADDADAPGLWPFAGRTLLEWQAKAALAAGATAVWVLAERLPEPMASRIMDLPGAQRLRHHAELAERLEGQDADIMLHAPGVVIDQRLLAALVRTSERPMLAVFHDLQAPAAAERIDRDTHWGGIMMVPSALMLDIVQGLGDWDLTSTLLRACEQAGAARLWADQVPTFDADARGERPLLWTRPESPERALATSRAIVAAAGTGSPDLADRFLHQPLARRLASATLASGLDSAIWQLVGLALAVAGLAGIALGWVLPGLLALTLAPITATAGRILAEVRGERSRWPTADMIAGYGVAIAGAIVLGWRLWWDGSGDWTLLAGGTIALLIGLRGLRLGWYRRTAGQHLDARSITDRRVAYWQHPLAGFSWPMLLFVAAGQPAAGLMALLTLSTAQYLLVDWRFLCAIQPRQPAPDGSSQQG